MPRVTRFVWVSSGSTLVPPQQGFVVDWRRHSYRWFALVLIVETPEKAPPLTKLQWLPVERLTPVMSNPNDGRPRRLS